MGGFGFPAVEDTGQRQPVQPTFELRPLSTGEILDRTFTLYRQRFWLYVGLSAIPAAVTTLTTFVQITLGLAGKAPQVNPDAAAAMRLGATTLLVTTAALLIHLLAYSITQAATVSAVEASYLGRETSIGAAFASVSGKWYRYVLVALWMGWSVAWPMLVVAIPAAILAAFVARGAGPGAVFAVVGVMALLLLPAFVVGFILYLRNSLGIVACVSEKLGVRASMKRSKNLVADYKVRAFLLYLLMLVLGMAVATVQYFFNIFLITSHGAVRAGVEIMTLLVTFLSGSLVAPVGAIAFVLFYLDQRVRKEGFDVELLLSKVTGVAPAARDLESPFSSAFGGATSRTAEESPFSTPFGVGAASARAADSPFSAPLPAPAVQPRRDDSPFSAPLPGAPPPPLADSPFTSGPLPGSDDVEKHG